MKTINANFCSLCMVLALCVAILFGCRCSAPKPIPTPDPLAGWTFKPLPGWELPPFGHNTNHLDKAIADDYQDFINNNHLTLADAVKGYFENASGQYAVQFVAFSHEENTTWTYVLFYDGKNRRIRVIKYNPVHYMS